MTPSHPELRSRPAHPMPGYLAVLPVPSEPPQPEPAAPVAAEPQGIGAMIAAAAKHTGTVRSGVLIERGAIPAGVSDDLMPYEEGATVHYFDVATITLGGFHYVPVTYVVAWEEPPR